MKKALLNVVLALGGLAPASAQTGRTNLIDPSQYKLGFGYNDDCYTNPTYYTTYNGGPYNGCINAYEQQSSDTSSGSTALIPVTPGASYFLTTGDTDNNNVGGPIYYGSNGIPIHSTFVPLPMAANQVFMVPTTTTEGVAPAYLRLRFRAGDIASAMLLTGSSAYSGAYISYTAPVKAAPTVNFALIGDHAYNAAPFQVSATSNSTGAITYSLASGPATVSASGLVTLTGANGTVGVFANVAADSNYTATQAGQTFAVTGAPVPVASTIVITPIPNKLYTDPPFQPTVNSNNTSQAAQSVTGPATIASPGIITLTGANGLVTYTWSQVADSLHLAGAASTTFVVTGAPVSGPQPGYTTVTGIHTGGDVDLISNATISFTPVAQNGTPISFRVGGNGGPIAKLPKAVRVTGGIFSLQVPDSCLTYPQNVGYRVEIVDDNSDENLLGPGYSFVQPCGSTWSLDDYKTNLGALALVTPGEAGADGAAGAAGLSAYQIYQQQGGTLSVTAWLASLVGAAGQNGQNGNGSPSQTEMLIEAALPSVRNMIDPGKIVVGYSYNEDCYNNPTYYTTANGGPYDGCVSAYEQQSSDTSAGSTALIPVIPGKSYYFPIGNPNNNNVNGWVYYDQTGAPIHSSLIHLPIANNYVSVAPSTAAYIRLFLRAQDFASAMMIPGAGPYTGPYIPFAQQPTTTALRSPWNGKKLATFGDSYTAAYGQVWKPSVLAYHNLVDVFQDARSGRPIGDDGLAGEGVFECYQGDPINGKFDPTYQPHSGAFGSCAAASPLAVSGNTLKQNLALYSPDLILLPIGTNTYSSNVPGAVSDAVGAATLHGQLKLLFSAFQTVAPYARILAIEPVQVTDTTVGRAASVTALIPIFEQEAALYAVSVIKMYSESGISAGNAGTFLRDGIHLTDSAYQKIFAGTTNLKLNSLAPLQ